MDLATNLALVVGILIGAGCVLAFRSGAKDALQERVAQQAAEIKIYEKLVTGEADWVAMVALLEGRHSRP